MARFQIAKRGQNPRYRAVIGTVTGIIGIIGRAGRVRRALVPETDGCRTRRLAQTTTYPFLSQAGPAKGDQPRADPGQRPKITGGIHGMTNPKTPFRGRRLPPSGVRTKALKPPERIHP